MDRKHIVLTAMAFLVASSGFAFADTLDNAADVALKAMSEKLAGAKSLRLKSERSIGSDSAGPILNTEILLVRPNKIKAVSKGKEIERQFYFDGEEVTLFSPKLKSYASASAAGDIDDLVDQLDEKFGFSPPIADLLVANPYDSLLGGEQTGKLVGEEVIAGSKCQHLKFSHDMVDWEIWIGEDSLPRKFMIIFKNGEKDPVALTFDGLEWDLGIEIDETAFAFAAPDGSKKVEMISPKDAAKKSAEK